MASLEDPDFARLPAEAAALLAAGAQESFFALPEWYEVFAGTALEPGVRPLVLTAGADAALLLAREPSVAGAPRRLRSLSSYYSCEHGPLLRPGADPEEAAGSLVRELLALSPGFDELVLAALDPAEQLVGALARALRRRGLAVRPFFDAGTWYEETAGLDFDGYVAARPSQLRNTWKRKSRALDRSGRGRFDWWTTGEGIDRGIAAYEAIYGESWKKREPFPEFMPSLIRRTMALGAGRLGVLSIDDRPAAAQFWIVWQGRACIYKLAHSESFDELSPGTILTMRITERVLTDDRPREINLGRGDDPYKKLWLPKRRERWGLRIANPRSLLGLKLAARQLAVRAVRRFRPDGSPPVPPSLAP